MTIARWFYSSMKKSFQEAVCWVLDRVFFYAPPFNWIKARVLNGFFGARIAPDSVLVDGVKAVNWGCVRIGSRAYLAEGVNLRSFGPITIGAWTIIGPEAMLASSGHSTVDLTPTYRPIDIGKGVFVGARAVILEGVTIGDHAVIGAGAVVTRDIPPLAIAVGSPAAVIGYRERPRRIWTITGIIDLQKP